MGREIRGVGLVVRAAVAVAVAVLISARSANAGPTELGDAAASPNVSTFSIVAADTSAGTWGIAVASKFLAVGSVVPWARADVGAVATQAFANTSYGPRGLELLERGLSAREALDVLLRSDSLAARRQVGVVDANGASATHTGGECMAWAGGRSGPGYAAQGNILTGPEVVDAMAKSFETSTGFLGDRLLEALEAADAAGGDSRGRQSASIYLVAQGRGFAGGNDILCDLRVDDAPSPLVELRRVYNVWRPNQLILDGYAAVELAKFDEAIALGRRAAELDAASGGPNYHLACFFARAGRADDALRELERAVARDEDLRVSAKSDPDFKSLRERAEWKRLIDRP